MADVEELNTLAASGGLDVVKISMAASESAVAHYRLLSCGGALGRGCGPLLLARQGRDPGVPFGTLALPGARTTAALLAGMSGVSGKRVQLRYDEIMPALASGEAAGVPIGPSFEYASPMPSTGSSWSWTSGLGGRAVSGCPCRSG